MTARSDITPDTGHGFILIAIAAILTVPIWLPLFGIACGLFVIAMLAYFAFWIVFGPVRYLYRGIRFHQWEIPE